MHRSPLRAAIRQSLALLLALFLGAALAPPLQAQGAARPNIVWILVDDMSPDFGSYGNTAVATPVVDRMAREGVRFDRAMVTGPICSPARSALITGMYQTTIGAHQHRSGRGEITIPLPAPVRPVPALMREAGYQVLNLSRADFVRSEAEVAKSAEVGIAKTDYNFAGDDDRFYDRVHWTRRPAGQPFFAQVQLSGGKLRGHGDTERWPERFRKELGETTPMSAVKLPAYLPNDPVIREDWRQYLDAVRYTDHEVGLILDRLRQAGELENTLVVFMTDHGISHVRNKQFLYDGGIHVPLVIRGPGVRAGTVRNDLVEHIDVAALSLAAARVGVPRWMQARNILAADYAPRDMVFSARDRADETVDRMRAVRTDRYKYIRNFHPKRPYLQPNNYKDGKPIVQAMRRLHAAGKLDRNQSLIMADTRPEEELYDLAADPEELRNLAGDPAHRATLMKLRGALDRWMVETGDKGPESMAAYDSDMAVYLSSRAEHTDTRRNIELMKRWAAEGK